jgi:hypothetical protein
MDYIKAFAVGGAFCLIGQILIDKTKLTPARILVSYVVIGVILGGIGIYKPLTDSLGKFNLFFYCDKFFPTDLLQILVQRGTLSIGDRFCNL